MPSSPSWNLVLVKAVKNYAKIDTNPILVRSIFVGFLYVVPNIFSSIVDNSAYDNSQNYYFDKNTLPSP